VTVERSRLDANGEREDVDECVDEEEEEEDEEVEEEEDD